MDNKDLNVDELMDKIDEINKKLAGKDISLTESIELYKQGVELAASCKEQLTGIERELFTIQPEE